MTTVADRSTPDSDVAASHTQSTAFETFLGGVLAQGRGLPESCRRFVQGGKRLRARLLFACGGDSSGVYSTPLFIAAAAIELFHAASLLHDDIVDRAETRRHVSAMYRSCGVRAASLSGWSLGQLALTLIADLPHHARERFAEAGRATSRGQLAEIVRAYDTSVLPEDRLTIMEQKTAAIFGVSCELGGMLSGVDEARCIRLRRLGESFGMLFQIADDVDDLFANADELGRAPGADLAAGVISLLGAYALQSDAKPDAVAVLGGRVEGTEAVAGARSLMRSSGALRAAFDTAVGYAQSARGHLSVLVANEGTAWMGSLVDGTLARIERRVDAAY